MKTDKEYPATHSMSTAWYVADKDGNVGIIDIDDNGPVPWETEQTCTQELVFGHEEGDKFLRINLTDDQIYELMEEPHQPEEEDSWFDIAVLIDKTQEEEFQRLSRNKDIDCFVISSKLGLYGIDNAYQCFAHGKDCSSDPLIENSSLWTMLKNKMIVSVYRYKDFFVNGVWDNGKVKYEVNFKSAPYFIYAQPYWNELPAERLNVPDNPVKLSQFPENLRERVCRLPVRFRECDKFQIAEWVPCSFSTGEEQFIDGCKYSLLPINDGTEAYVLSDIDEIDFINYCPEREKYQCKECLHVSNCYTPHASTFTNRPTVMEIVSPYRGKDYNKQVITDDITLRSIILPFIPKIPWPSKCYISKDEVGKVVSQQMLNHIFVKCHKYLDDMLRRYRPRVVIIGEDAYDALKLAYNMNNQTLESDGEKYPFFMESEIERNRRNIEALAKMPYRGKEFPLVISKEDIEPAGKINKRE